MIKRKWSISMGRRWECGTDDHCHRTKAAATKCIGRANARKPHMKGVHRQESAIIAARMLVSGKPLLYIGRKLGVSSGQARRLADEVFIESNRVTGADINYSSIKVLRALINQRVLEAKIDAVEAHWKEQNK